MRRCDRRHARLVFRVPARERLGQHIQRRDVIGIHFERCVCRFFDFSAGIAVVSTGHCHPRVVEAIQRQAARLIHMSVTDFYYENLVLLAEKLAGVLRNPLSSPLQKEIIVVQSKGMERWVSMELAGHQGRTGIRTWI